MKFTITRLPEPAIYMIFFGGVMTRGARLGFLYTVQVSQGLTIFPRLNTSNLYTSTRSDLEEKTKL